jgi:membrane protease YdiL (CAAX protease family)
MLLACVALAVAANRALAIASPALQISIVSAATAGVFAVLAVSFAGLEPLPPGMRARRLGLGRSVLDRRSLAALALGTVALSHAVDAAIHLVGATDIGTLAELDHVLANMTAAELPLALAGLALAPGLAEELFFRGLVQRGIAARLGPGLAATALAVGTAALFFALAHFDPVQSPGALALGVYLGVVAWLAGSTRAAMLCHVLNNAVAVMGAYLGAEIGLGEHAPVTLALGTGVAAAALLPAWRSRQRLPEAPPPNPLQMGPRSADP